MFKNLSFSRKLICILGFFSLISVVSVGFSGYLLIKTYIIKNARKELSQITEATYNLVETTSTVSIRNYLRAIAESHREVLRYYYEQVQQQHLDEEEAKAKTTELLLRQQIGETGYLAYLDSSGVLRAHPEESYVGVDISDQEFIQQVIKMKDGYIEYMWQNPGDEAERAKSAYVVYFEPWDYIIFASSYKSEFHSLIHVDDFREKILTTTLGETGYAFIVDSQGNTIIHPYVEDENFYDYQDIQGRYFIREMCAQKNGEIEYFWKNPGEETDREKLVYYRYLQTLDWIIACGIYKDELYAPINRLIATNFGMSLGIVVVVSILAVFIGRTFTKPLRILASHVMAIGNGDLSVKVPFKGKDEIGDLARTFNSMSASLRTFIGQVQRSGIQVSSSSTELAATAKQQEAIVSTQVQSTNNVVQSVKHISEVATHLVATMQDVASMLQETTEFASSGQTDLGRMEEAMRHMEHASKMISGKLEAINEKAENITTVVTTINKVADQTNLLSLNAAIEAEKAGEYGRGFTVVAREIRRLADQTAVATLDIDMMVQEMQTAVSAGVMEMDKFISEVRRSAEDVERISLQLSRIIEQVQALSPRFEEVNESMEEQSGHARQINEAMMNLSEEMAQTKDSLHETYSAIEQLNEAARGLQNQVSRFKIGE